ncbi:MAG TPA: glutamate racemase [Blastocatellia bacterium]|nr:glutamate racemase [Blastocatellia bacterium]
MNSLPIGIFDSGVGGLTVLRAVRERLPHENTLYLGDTARVPYGTKSQATVERYALEDAAFLESKGVKMIIVACNTASALAGARLRKEFSLPLLSVIGPGARAAVRATRTGRIGVIATEATIDSGAYEKRIREVGGERHLDVYSRACPLFVPLAEEGETDSQVARLLAEQYLAPLREQGIDTLVLGCTHYPLLKKVISETMGPSVQLVDSAEATAIEVATLLNEHKLLNEQKEQGSKYFFVTDAARRFTRIASRFLGEPLEHIEAVEVSEYDRVHSS